MVYGRCCTRMTALRFKVPESRTNIGVVGVIVFLIAMLAFGALFLSGRVNKNEDIHITE